MKYEVVSQTQEKHPQPTGDVEGPGAPPSVNEVVLATVREGEPLQTLLGHLSGLQMQVHVCSEFRDIHRRLADNHCAILLLDEEPGRPDTGLSNDHLGRLLAEFPHLRIIALLPRGVPLGPRFSELLERGWIYDFHTLPLDVDRLSVMIGHLQGLVELERRQEGPGDNRRAGFGPIIGRSPKMRTLFDNMRRVAKTDTPVLITGESGTGKELVARTLHQRSKFASGTFVSINCAAIPDTLIESELFGYEAGAFTGADRRKRGRVEDAHKGTLFLDEIGDMPLSLQPHFLHFLQDGTFKRLGSTAALSIKTRVIAATNIDLWQAIRDRRFREDLFYRLNVVSLEIPPLRERGDDVDLLADYYLKKACTHYQRGRLQFSKGASAAMRQHSWPGNVRELASAVNRAVVLTKGSVIRPADLGLSEAGGENETAVPSLATARANFERDYVEASLHRNFYNVQRTARELGVSRVTLYRLAQRYGIPTSPTGGSKDDDT